MTDRFLVRLRFALIVAFFVITTLTVVAWNLPDDGKPVPTTQITVDLP